MALPTISPVALCDVPLKIDDRRHIGAFQAAIFFKEAEKGVGLGSAISARGEKVIRAAKHLLLCWQVIQGLPINAEEVVLISYPLCRLRVNETDILLS